MAPRRATGMDNVVGLEGPGYTMCCVPSGECLRAQQRVGTNPGEDPMAIALDDLRDTVRVSSYDASSSRLTGAANFAPFFRRSYAYKSPF